MDPIWTGRRRALPPGHPDAPTTYYHVAPPTYRGGDLICAAAQGEEAIINSRQKWEIPEPYWLEDWEVVSLHDNLPEAIDYRDEYEPDGVILVIRLTAEDIREFDLTVGVNTEGYPYVKERIPSDLIIDVLAR